MFTSKGGVEKCFYPLGSMNIKKHIHLLLPHKSTKCSVYIPYMESYEPLKISDIWGPIRWRQDMQISHEMSWKASPYVLSLGALKAWDMPIFDRCLFRYQDDDATFDFCSWRDDFWVLDFFYRKKMAKLQTWRIAIQEDAHVKYGAFWQPFFCGTPIGFCQETMPRPRSRVGIVGTTGCGKCGSPGWDYPEKVAEKGTSFRAKQIRRLGEISSFWPRIMVEQSSNS